MFFRRQFPITSEKKISVIVLIVTKLGSLKKAVHWSGREFKGLKKKWREKWKQWGRSRPDTI